MNLVFKPASKEQTKLKISVAGQSGSGKTMSALKLARGLATNWNKVFIIDTEKGSNKYADLGAFNVLEMLPPYSPDACVWAIQAATKAGAEVIVIDSATAEWEGKGGCLEIMDQLKQSSRTGDSFAGWAKVGALHKKFIDAILNSGTHVIATVRTKTDWVIELNDKGKNAPRKVGVKEIQRDGWEYEFDIALNVSRAHYAECDKDRTNTISDAAPFIITEELGAQLKAWSQTGTLPPLTSNSIEQPPEQKQAKPPLNAVDILTKKPYPTMSMPSNQPTRNELDSLLRDAKLMHAWTGKQFVDVMKLVFNIEKAGELSRLQFETIASILMEANYEDTVLKLTKKEGV